jgi:beta-glucosidase
MSTCETTVTRAEYHFFLEHNVKHRCIMGNDYYVSNEHRVTVAGTTEPCGEIFGYDEITWQYTIVTESP